MEKSSSNSGEGICLNLYDINSSETAEEVIIEQCNENNYVEIDNIIEIANDGNDDDTGINKSRQNVSESGTIVQRKVNESTLSSSDEATLHKKINNGKITTEKSHTNISNREIEIKKVVKKKHGSIKFMDDSSNNEDTTQEVKKRFEMGCECSESCFRGLNAETVNRHRLNIAELTKEEHDMYLMGVTMASTSDPVNTNKRRERQRARANYAYNGRKVCLSAFLYLENVTLYQMKRIRKHVMTQGVTPRIHGNHGKKPHNVFPLDIYRMATTFLKEFIQQYNVSGNPKGPMILPPDVTRKSLHNIYKDFVSNQTSPNEKLLGYSTFRHFVKLQFPNLKFTRPEPGSTPNNPPRSFMAKNDIDTGGQLKQEISPNYSVSEFPVVLTEPYKDMGSQTIIVTPLGQFLQGNTDMPSQTLEMSPQTIEIQPQNIEMQPQTIELRPQPLEIQPQTLEIQPQTVEIKVQPQTLEIQPQTFEIQPQTLQIQPQPHEMQHQTLEMQPQTLEIEVQSHPLEIKPQTLEIEVQSHPLEIKPQTLEIEVQSHPLEIKPQTLEIEVQSHPLEIKPQTLEIEVQSHPLEIKPQTIELQPQTFEIQPQAFEMQPQTLEIQPQTFEMQPQTFEMQPQTIEMQPQTIEIQPQTIEIQPQTYEMSPQTIEIQPQTFEMSVPVISFPNQPFNFTPL